MPLDKDEIVRRARVAFNARDADAFGRLLAADAEIVPLRAALEGTVYSGPDAVTRFFADMEEAWEMLNVEEELEIREGGDWILSIGRLQGRGRGSGAEFDMKMGWVVRVREGKITSFRTYADPDAAREAVGLSE